MLQYCNLREIEIMKNKNEIILKFKTIGTMDNGRRESKQKTDAHINSGMWVPINFMKMLSANKN